MAHHGHRQPKGNVLSAFLGILMLIIIGGLCALGGYFMGAKQRPDQVSLVPGSQKTERTTTVTSSALPDDGDMLSRTVPFSVDDLRNQCIRLKFAPFQRGDLAFDVVVPQSWTWQTVQVNESDLAMSNTREVQIAEMESPGSSLAIMQSWFMQVPDGVSLSQFSDSYTKARGFKMVEKAAEVGNRMDMLIGYDTPKQKDIQSRITAIKVGKNVMWLACCAPRSEYPIWNKAFTLAANSFSPAAAPIAFQPDVPTKLAQGAVFAQESTKIDDSKTGTPVLGQPSVPKPTATVTTPGEVKSDQNQKPKKEGIDAAPATEVPSKGTGDKKQTSTGGADHSGKSTKQPPINNSGGRNTPQVLH